jgi:hypothetical protein
VGIGIELSQQEMNCTNHEESSRKSNKCKACSFLFVPNERGRLLPPQWLLLDASLPSHLPLTLSSPLPSSSSTSSSIASLRFPQKKITRAQPPALASASASLRSTPVAAGASALHKDSRRRCSRYEVSVLVSYWLGVWVGLKFQCPSHCLLLLL